MRASRPGARPWLSSTRRRRRAEQGAALFIVVLVIMALTGVAIFAAKSASTDVEVAGRYRQALQTHQLARLGMQSAFSELSRDPETYIRAMTDATVFGAGAPACDNQVKQLYAYDPVLPANGDFTGTAIDTGGCFAFQYNGIQTAMGTAAADPTLWLVSPGIASHNNPSGLGGATTRPDFKVEMTDKDTWDQPVMGFASGSGINMKFYTVTMTAKGLVLPRDPAAVDGSFGATTSTAGPIARASVEQIRAQVMVGPLPDGL